MKHVTDWKAWISFFSLLGVWFGTVFIGGSAYAIQRKDVTDLKRQIAQQIARVEINKETVIKHDIVIAELTKSITEISTDVKEIRKEVVQIHSAVR